MRDFLKSREVGGNAIEIDCGRRRSIEREGVILYDETGPSK